MPHYNLFPTPIYSDPATLSNYDPVQLEVKAVLDIVKQTGEGISYTYHNIEKWNIENSTKSDGFIIHDNIIKTYNMHKLQSRIEEALERYANNSGWFGLKRSGSFKIMNSWMNINKKGIHHEYHCHPGYTLAGVYYFRVNELQGGINFNNPNQMMYNMAFPGGDRYPASINIVPRDGDIILFPAWLQHSTDVNKSDEERVSIAFNIDYIVD